ncbi:hypothetical protein DK66_3091 [Brucella suis 1330]|nr:hypothetical protein DK66_3091 [Brucella suis 1330]
MKYDTPLVTRSGEPRDIGGEPREIPYMWDP